MAAKEKRIQQDVLHIDSESELLRYALAGQLARLLDQQKRHLSQANVAYAAGMGGQPHGAGSALSTLLGSPKTPTIEMLHRLDRAISAAAPKGFQAGSLASLAVRLSERPGDVTGLVADLPARWNRLMMHVLPTTEMGVLNQASALLSEFRYASRMDGKDQTVSDVRARYAEQLDRLVEQLIQIAIGPPTPLNFDAQLLLGSLASYASESTLGPLEHHLTEDPLGFRVWRAITKLVKLSHPENPNIDKLKAWVRNLLLASNNLRGSSLYPGRSLDLELAITIPESWSKAPQDWVATVLLDRARNSDATIRERGTAALGLWQRALLPGHDPAATAAQLEPLIQELETAEDRPDAASGMRWVASTLRYLIHHQLPVVNDWDAIEVTEPWMGSVEVATAELDHQALPSHLLTGTKNLFRHAMLQNAGVYRRQAIETLTASGFSEQAARAFGRVLDREDEPWVRIRALFALGYLQNTNRFVERDLTNACKRAVASLDGAPTRAEITELHTALCAVGDSFGSATPEHVQSVREGLAATLEKLATGELTHPEGRHPIARATAYLVSVTARPGDNTKQLLEQLVKHPDSITQRLSQGTLARLGNDKIEPMWAHIG